MSDERSQIQIEVTVSNNGSSSFLTIKENGKALAHATMEAPELDDFIELLGKCRAAMADVVPRELEPSGRISALDDPIWRTKLPRKSPVPCVLLALRHPGFGWIGHALPAHEAKAMGQSLSDLSQLLSPPKADSL
jgi:hypothetical protein